MRENRTSHIQRPPGRFQAAVKAFRQVNDRSLLLFQLSHSGRLSGPFSTAVKAYEDGTDVPVLSEAALDEAVDPASPRLSLPGRPGPTGWTSRGATATWAGVLRLLNRRDDRYGGAPENRARYAATVIREIKRGYPIFWREAGSLSSRGYGGGAARPVRGGDRGPFGYP